MEYKYQVGDKVVILNPVGISPLNERGEPSENNLPFIQAMERWIGKTVIVDSQHLTTHRNQPEYTLIIDGIVETSYRFHEKWLQPLYVPPEVPLDTRQTRAKRFALID